MMIKNLSIAFILIILFSCSENVLSQENKVGNWIGYFGNQSINKKWNFHNEVQYRNYNFIGEINQLLFRTGLGYNLTKNNDNVLLGYAFLQSHPYIPIQGKNNTTEENRIFEQLIHRIRIKNHFFTNRIRIEERFLSAGFRCRFRYLFSVNKPILKPEIKSNTFYLTSFNEVFFNDRGHAFDRDRISLGFGYAINNYLRFESGFMFQIFPDNQQKQLQLSLVNNIPFHKTK